MSLSVVAGGPRKATVITTLDKDPPQTISLPLRGRTVQELHYELRRCGLQLSIDYWLGAQFHARLRTGYAELTFAKGSQATVAYLIW